MNYLNLDREIFYSIVNMKLRDFYDSLEEFCKSENIEIDEMNRKIIENKMLYDKNNNRLVEL